ncbi:hypothetical protein IAU60_000039 [Kwoniella sp. DSM 27419]
MSNELESAVSRDNDVAGSYRAGILINLCFGLSQDTYDGPDTWVVGKAGTLRSFEDYQASASAQEPPAVKLSIRGSPGDENVADAFAYHVDKACYCGEAVLTRQGQDTDYTFTIDEFPLKCEITIPSTSGSRSVTVGGQVRIVTRLSYQDNPFASAGGATTSVRVVDIWP